MTAARVFRGWLSRCALPGLLLSLAACGSPYRLAPVVTGDVGQSVGLFCRNGEVQICRDHGTRMQCTCRGL